MYSLFLKCLMLLKWINDLKYNWQILTDSVGQGEVLLIKKLYQHCWINLWEETAVLLAFSGSEAHLWGLWKWWIVAWSWWNSHEYYFYLESILDLSRTEKLDQQDNPICFYETIIWCFTFMLSVTVVSLSLNIKQTVQ